MVLTKAYWAHNSLRNATTTPKKKQRNVIWWIHWVFCSWPLPVCKQSVKCHLHRKADKNALARSSFQVNIWLKRSHRPGKSICSNWYLNSFEFAGACFHLIEMSWHGEQHTCSYSKIDRDPLERVGRSIVVAKIVIQMFIVELWIVRCWIAIEITYRWYLLWTLTRYSPLVFSINALQQPKNDTIITITAAAIKM